MSGMNCTVEDIVGFLTTWMTYIRDEQAMTTRMNVSYMPGVSEEYRRGRADGLRLAESTLGLLAYEHGIDLRDAGKSNTRLDRQEEAR
jgi:hypothetical protein